MTIHFTTGPERKKLAAAVAHATGTQHTYAGAPTMSYIAGNYTISREGVLTGPDDHDLIAALKQQGFVPIEEAYEDNPAQPEQPERLTIEVPIDSSFTSDKLVNLEKLVASRDTLLKKVLGAEAPSGHDGVAALPIERTETSLKFPWFPVDDNAMVYGQLVAALVRTAQKANRITAREKQDCASEKFRMRTMLLRIGFIGDSYKEARKILTQGLSGSGSYAKTE